MVQLRPYQEKAIDNIYRAIEAGHKRVVLAAATAFGKTVVSSHICKDAIASGLNVLFIVHLECLIDQTANKMRSLGIEPGFIKAGYGEDLDASLQIASVQTLARRSDWKNKKIDLVILDECHSLAFHEIIKEIMSSVFPNAIYIGMTATTKRLGEEQLGDYFEVLIDTPLPRDLQAQGYLSPMRYFVPAPKGQPNLIDVKTVDGDYEEESLKNACDTPELVAAVVHEWKNNKEIGAAWKPTIAFCINKEHATNVARAFHANGVPAACIVGEHNPAERKQLYQLLREKKIYVLTSVDVISIGFDEPSVEVGLMLRPTQSEALFLQQVGRLMRISPETGKTEGIIIDQAGNCTRHPKPEEIDEYTLPVSKPKSGGGVARIKHCPVCDRMNYNFVRDCVCGYHYTTKQDINANGMIEIYPGSAYSANKLKKEFQEYRLEAFHSWVPPIEAEKRFAKEYGFSPIDEWYEGTIVRSDRMKDVYFEYLTDSAKTLKQDEHWAAHQYALEFGMVA